MYSPSHLAAAVLVGSLAISGIVAAPVQAASPNDNSKRAPHPPVLLSPAEGSTLVVGTPFNFSYIDGDSMYTAAWVSLQNETTTFQLENGITLVESSGFITTAELTVSPYFEVPVGYIAPGVYNLTVMENTSDDQPNFTNYGIRATVTVAPAPSTSSCVSTPTARA